MVQQDAEQEHIQQAESNAIAAAAGVTEENGDVDFDDEWDKFNDEWIYERNLCLLTPNIKRV